MAILTVADAQSMLENVGYNVSPDDEEFLGHLVKEVTNELTSPLGCMEIPDSLLERATDKVVGEFLFFKYSIGKLGSLSVDKIPKQITEGDISITNGLDKTADQILREWIDSLRTIPKSELSSVRSLKWF